MGRLDVRHDEASFKRAIWKYKVKRFTFVFVPFYVVGLLAIALVVAAREDPEILAGMSWHMEQVSPEEFSRAVQVVAPVALLVVFAVFLWRWSRGLARTRFFRKMGRSIALLPGSNDHSPHDAFNLVKVLNKVGIAARAIFLDLQRSHRVWKSPPMVADRATLFSVALIDFDIDGKMHTEDVEELASLKHLLYDFSVVVAIGREDLLPAVRKLHVKPRTRNHDAAKRERDIRYLNALRDRSKWDVAKDFWYPLAPWLSLIVAIAALVVSITRP